MGSQKTDPLWVIPPPVESTLDRFLRFADQVQAARNMPEPIAPEDLRPLGWRPPRVLPDDLSAEEYRRRALACLERTDPNYGVGPMFVETAHVYALLAQSAGGGER